MSNANTPLEAGAEMDLLVWRRVFGEHEDFGGHPCDVADHDVYYDGWCPECKTTVKGWCQSVDNVALPFSTSIADAWRVVEHLCNRFVFSLAFQKGCWTCQVHTLDTYKIDVDGNAPTAPLAICRAALAACEGGK